MCVSDKLQVLLHQMHNFPESWWDLSIVTLSLFLWYKPSISGSCTGLTICTYQVDTILEGQTRTYARTLQLNFSYTGETEASFQSWFEDSSTSLTGQPEILIQTISQGSSFSLWFERREFRGGFGVTGEVAYLWYLEKEKGIVCLQTKQANKWTVFPSENYEINEGKHKRRTPHGHLGWLAVLKQAQKGWADLQHTESSSLVIKQLSQPESAAQPELLVSLNLVAGPRTHNLADDAAAFVVMPL